MHLHIHILNRHAGRRLREAKEDIRPVEQISESPTQVPDSETSPGSHESDASHLDVTSLRWSRDFESTTVPGSAVWQVTNFSDLGEVTPGSSSVLDAQLADPKLLPNNLYTRISSPLSSSITLPLTVFTALFLNGQILSIQCSTTTASKSSLPTAAVPISLRPTVSQLTTVHYQWIDRLPFPKLRDSLIRLQSVVDLDEFLNDIFVAPSFSIKRGAESWDAQAWSMEAVWAKKWGWLFF